jgi:hypothetical protein
VRRSRNLFLGGSVVAILLVATYEAFFVSKTETVSGFFQRAGDLCGLSRERAPAKEGNEALLGADPEALLRSRGIFAVLDQSFCRNELSPGAPLTIEGERVSSERATGYVLSNVAAFLVHSRRP